MIVYRLLQQLAAFMPSPPAFTMEQIANILCESIETTQEALQFCLDNDYVIIYKSRVGLTERGMEALKHVAGNSSIEPGSSLQSYKSEVLTGIKEKGGKLGPVTVKSEIDNGVLPTVNKRVGHRKNIEKILQVVWIAKDRAEKENISIEDVLDKMIGGR